MIKDFDIQCHIGTERNANEDKAYHVITIVLTATRIDPVEFAELEGKKTLRLEVL